MHQSCVFLGFELGVAKSGEEGVGLGFWAI